MNKIIFLCLLLAGWAGIALCQSNTRFRFAHVSDTHVGNPTGAKDLRATIEDINSMPDIAFVIISGDITDFGSDEQLLEAKALFDQLNKPWYIVPGNHDTKWSESGGTTFRRIFGSETFSFEYKGYWFMGTNCGPNMRMGPGQVPRENLVWMDSVLAAHPDKKQPMFFVNHYPVNNGLNNWYEVLDRLKDRNLKAILCGHGHANRVMDFDGIPGIMGRSNQRGKEPVGAYNIVTCTADSLYYNLRKPGLATLPVWHSVSIAKNNLPQWTANPVRPDYTANQQYNTVREKWAIQEKADIGSGVGVYQQMVLYTTTGGWIKAVNSSDGKPRWSFHTGGKIYATPLVLDQYVIVSSTNGNIYCLSAKDGKQQWMYTTGKPIVSSAAGYKDRVIIAGSDRHCRALDIKTGNLLWDYDKLNNFVETKPLIDHGIVYFGSWGNQFYALDAMTGKLVWQWNSGHANEMYSAAACWPVVSGNRLFVVAPDRFMTVLNKVTGAIIWRNYDTLNLVRESMGLSKDGRQVYVKTMQGKIQAIDANAMHRQVNWTSPEELGFDVCPSPINEHNNTVFVPSQSGMIYALQKDNGQLRWKHKISNCLINIVTPLDENTLITSSMDGKIVCLTF